jgi:hypothetical protein
MATGTASARPFNRLSLSATATQVASGGSVKITATASDIPPNSYIALFDNTAPNPSPTYVINFCFATTTCSVTDSHVPPANTAGTHTYLARIVTNTNTGDGPVVVATSAPLNITWGYDAPPCLLCVA